jgi:oxygen-independent coproporphyrinogen-3 oxidase
LPDDESTETMLEATSAALAEAGYARYEVSAYARAGRRCAHNLLYWQFGDYLGVGAGAHGKLSGIDTSGTNASDGLTIRRSTQPREPRRYQRDPRGGLLWCDVAVAERPFEFMLNAMRLAEGFDGRLFEARTGVRWSTVEPTLRRLGERDLLTLTGDRAWQVAPTATGLRWLNELLLEFLSAEADTRPGRRS